MIYVLLFLYEGIITYIYDKKYPHYFVSCLSKKNKLKISLKEIFIIAAIFVPLWLLMGLRYYIGADYGSYENMFMYTITYKRNYPAIEVGYACLNSFIGMFTKNSQIMFLTVAFIIIFFYIKAIMQNLSQVYYCVLVFMGFGYYYYAMNIQRQYIAIAIMFWALKFLETKKFYKYMACVIISMLFHSSAVICILLYFILNYVDTKVFYMVSLIVSIVACFIRDNMLNILAKINFYTGQIQNNATFFSTHFSFENVLLSAIVIIAIFVLYKKLISMRAVNSIRIKMVWLVFLMYLFLYGYGAAMTRIAAYLCPVYLLLIPDIVNCFDLKSRQLLRPIITVALLVLMYMVLSVNDYIPYAYRLSESKVFVTNI